ncbi:MAG: glycine--tRNA ligase [Euryarchaeota archaeon]|nr:glycine--tRNA ligase [Euryarchaeota archaeon]
MADGLYERIFELAKRRGFLYPSFEPYGGAAGFYDYGPLGAQLKAGIENLFRRIFVVEEGCAEISCPAVTVEEVFVASGHVAKFDDPVVRCQNCRSPFRADHLIEEAGYKGNAALLKNEEIDALAKKLGVKCKNCGGPFGAAYRQNLMFKTEIGPGSGKVGYLRPETAQGIFVDYPYLYRYFREQLPFGVCQIGRAYRNEISPRQGVLRLREFNQMEVEVFIDPQKLTHAKFARVQGTRLRFLPKASKEIVEMTIGDAVAKGVVANEALAYYLVLVDRLLTQAGIDPKRLRFRQHEDDEKAHYARDTWDAEFQSERFGWVECVGIADRSAYDLTQHAKLSGTPMRAVRRYETPQKREVVQVRSVPAKLGPLFKKEAGAVTAALLALPADRAEAAAAAKEVEVIVDGRKVTVPRAAYDVVRETVTVAGDDYVPNVIEPSFGVDRILYAVLEHSYVETTKEGEAYTVLRLPLAMAPMQVGVFPLMPKDGLDAVALDLLHKLQAAGLRALYDESGAIGRRYARMDEVGTPYCVTVDYDSLKDQSATVRERDSTKQERVRFTDLVDHLRRRFSPFRDS